MERRNFIRALIAVAIGIPIAVEGTTFYKLFRERLSGSERPEDGDGTGVGTGDDLLPETAQSETVTALERTESGEDAVFRLALDITNTGEEPYRLKVGPLVLADGSRVEGTTSTGEIPSGETATLEAEWTTESGSRVTGVWAGAHSGSDSVTREVDLASTERSD